MLLLLLLWLPAIGCKMTTGIPGVLGLKWGEDASAAAARIGVQCAAWQPWVGGQGIEVCFDLDHPVRAFGGSALARVLRRGTALLGLQLVYPGCDEQKWQALRGAIEREFNLRSAEATPYYEYHDGSALHVSRDARDASCTVTVAGPEMARPFQELLLKQGLGAVVEKVRRF